MGFFSKSGPSSIQSSNATIIAAGTKIKGDIKARHKVHVAGKFSGSIESSSIITIGENGVVEGDLVSEKLIVSGGFTGIADCEEIQILTGGSVTGRITCRLLVIDRGGFFNGQNKLKESIPHLANHFSCEVPFAVVKNMADNVTGVLEIPENMLHSISSANP